MVICCYNSAGRLPETLAHLARQRVPAEIPWEVVVVDNASTDETAQAALRCWAADAPAPLRVVSEPKPGIGHARHRGLLEAQQAIVGFLDDDNWVDPDWVAKVSRFFDGHPEAAAVGGPSKAAFESSAPPWFSRVSGAYAVGSQHGSNGDMTDRQGTLLWTAGMSLRRKTVLELFAAGFEFTACTGALLPLVRGEDAELCFALRATGSRLYYDSGLAIVHFMPASRLQWPNALKHFFHQGEASPFLELYTMAFRWPPYAAAPGWKMTWAFQTAKSLAHLFRMALAHPRECLRQPEGSLAALRLQFERGRLSSLLRLCGHYGGTLRAIRSSPWARRGAARKS